MDRRDNFPSAEFSSVKLARGHSRDARLKVPVMENSKLTQGLKTNAIENKLIFFNSVEFHINAYF